MKKDVGEIKDGGEGNSDHKSDMSSVFSVFKLLSESPLPHRYYGLSVCLGGRVMAFAKSPF